MRWLLVPLLLLLSAPALAQPNIILVVLDDVTACWVEQYDIDAATAADCNGEWYETPQMDAFAVAGVLVTRAWGLPVCSPYRASILTGTLPREHNIGGTINIQAATKRRSFQAARPNLARTLGAAGYTTRMFGKHHLGAFELGEEALIRHPVSIGFGAGNGTLSQTNQTVTGVGGVGYEDWENCNFLTGSCVQDTDYATTQVVDDAIAALTLDEPFFIYMPMNAPHSPFHKPPTALFTATLDCDDDVGAPDLDEACYAAALEAADTELGRLIAAYDPTDTILIITADNGTPNQASKPIATNTNPSWIVDRCKGNVTECGLWVPLMVDGVGIDTGTADILVSATDLHATILDLAGVENVGAAYSTGSLLPSLGGRNLQYRSVSFADNLKDVSLPSRRSCIYAEQFVPDETTGAKTNWHEGIRNATHKLMRHNDDGETYAEEFFLTSSIYEVAPTDHLALSGDDYDFLTAKMDLMNETGGDPCR